MNNKLYDGLNKQYSLAKTLRFELIPIGKTKDNIIKNEILKNDETRSIQYKKIKNIIDIYHKDFIDKSLCGLRLNDLDEYIVVYKKLQSTNDISLKKEIIEIKRRLRKQIAENFKSQKEFTGIFGKEIIKEYLLDYIKSKNIKDEKLEKDIKDFENFTTYFKGFHENRKNMYCEEEKSTAISYRIIDENLPIFINNMKIYKRIKENIESKDLLTLQEELSPFMMVENLDQMFELEYFNDVLGQKQIEVYNVIISGYSDSKGRKIKGLNELINLYNQRVSKENRIPKVRQLLKQILSDKIGASFVIDAINNDKELVESLATFNKIYQEEILSSDNQENINIKALVNNLKSYDINKIYINGLDNINKISSKIFGLWSLIIDSIGKDYDEKYNGKNSLGDERYEKEKEIIIKNSNYSIGYILGCLKNIDNNYENIFMDYFILYGKSENSIFDSIDSGYFEVSELFEKYYNEKKDLIKDEDSIVKIKLYLDNIFKLYDDLSILSLNGETLEKDDFFYNSYHHILSNLKLILNLYNKIRNYLTQKSYSDEKIKINFENSTLLDGWDLNKEKDNLSIIFRKDNLFYLGIINKKLKNKNVFDEEIFKKFKANNDFYEKMEYKLLPGPNKMLPKVFFSKSRIDEFKPSVDLLKKYYEGCHKKGEKFDLPFCHELIDFFKRSISIHDWKDFDFSFSPTNSYRDISGFYKEVEFQGYKLKFKNIPTAYIEELVNEDKLYLFKIYNKDFSEHSKGRPNLHTMYFKAIFDQLADKDNISYKLNGQAEIFYREASLKLNETVIHKNNEAIKNKNHLNEKKDSTFNYDLIKDRRFTEDKFFFHVPITLNFHNEGNNNLNNIVNTNIQKCEDFYIIGVDRGERHLIYLSLINQKGEIIKQFSLNEIINEHDNNLYKVDYHRLLEEKAGSRDEARKNWKTIKNIKELKAGYLSQVINKIVELMDEYNAIIVLEDLNFGFKNSRIKFEKQVYQKFEKMLIDKLNYLVLKKKGVHEPGGLLNAYQLTNRFESFKTMQKQSGILFYIPAWNTSKIDPTTGFVNLFNLRYENIQKAKDLISKFKDIRYNFVEKYFEFNFDYNDFTNKPYGARNQWCICTYSTRVETFRNTQKNNMWDSREIKLTDEFNDLFCKYNIDVNSLQVDIYSQDSKEFYERLLYLLRLTLQLRNSITGTDIDYMVSPVKNGDGVFFDSRKGYVRWPLDADANGAYNIARKGAMLISQIKLCDEEKLKSIKFSLSNDDWLTYVQSRQ